MSNSQKQQGPSTPRKLTGDSWGDPITDDRKAELEMKQRAWEIDHGDRPGPFADVHLTGADVFWLAKKALVDVYGDIPAVEQTLRDPRHSFLLDISQGLPALHLEGADLRGAHLEGAFLVGARMEEAILVDAHLENAILIEARLGEANLNRSNLEMADLRSASFDKTSHLNYAHLNYVALDQVTFDNTNLALIDWNEVRKLGDEITADQSTHLRAGRYRSAARAYRTLFVVLHAQGLARYATRFHYRAEVMDRKSLFYEVWELLSSNPNKNSHSVLNRFRLFGKSLLTCARWLLSLGLGLFVGYGDYLWRLFLTYMVIICACAVMFFIMAHLRFTYANILDALAFSLTAFHGRGLAPPSLNFTDQMTWLAGVESFMGLLIEGLFIATFTRRVTGN
jgi:hypothetical protein